MNHEETIMELMNQLVYATKHDIGELMAHKGVWTAGTSAVNNSYKYLTALTDNGLLEKGEGFFKLKGAKGQHQEHSQLLTQALVKILKLDGVVKVYRECLISEKGIIPDTIALFVKGDNALVFVLEVCHEETTEYLTQKINIWNGYENATKKLSELFGIEVKAFDIVVLGGPEIEGTFNFYSYLEAIKNEGHEE